MRSLPETRGFCRREVHASERVIALPDHAEMRVAEVTFREGVEGVRCMGCVSEDQREEARGRCTGPEVAA